MDPSPPTDGRHVDFSLKRCSVNQQGEKSEEDATVSQHKKMMNVESYLQRCSAKNHAVKGDEDIINDNSGPGRSLPNPSTRRCPNQQGEKGEEDATIINLQKEMMDVKSYLRRDSGKQHSDKGDKDAMNASLEPGKRLPNSAAHGDLSLSASHEGEKGDEDATIIWHKMLMIVKACLQKSSAEQQSDKGDEDTTTTTTTKPYSQNKGDEDDNLKPGKRSHNSATRTDISLSANHQGEKVDEDATVMRHKMLMIVKECLQESSAKQQSAKGDEDTLNDDLKPGKRSHNSATMPSVVEPMMRGSWVRNLRTNLCKRPRRMGLSAKAAERVRAGMTPQEVLAKLGAGATFARWRNCSTMYVKARVTDDGISVSEIKRKH